MRKLSLPTRLYILAVILVGSLLAGWHLFQLHGVSLWTLLAACALAALAQVLKVEGSTERSSYNTSWVVYAFSLVLLGPSAAVFVMLVSHVVEWAWYKYAWYIQLFNIAAYVLCFSIAGLLVGPLSRGEAQVPSSLNSLGLIVAALALFTVLNHLLIGVVVWLARGQNFKESGVFDRMPLVIDFTLLVMGTGAALLWFVHPAATLLALIPLYLIYATLRIPALQRQTQTDSKTGLYNAQHFTHNLESELARADRFDRPLTVVMADLDLLRNINNTYGHLAGDVVLVGVAQILAKSVREYDIVARFGGEEFAILMPETTPEQAIPRVQAIRAAVEGASFQVSTSVTPIHVTMSFGLAGRTQTGQSPTELVHLADLAVYQAKLAGRNQVCLTTPQGVTQPDQLPPGLSSLDEVPAPTGHLAPLPEVPDAPVPPPAATTTLRAKVRPAWALNVFIGLAAFAAVGLLALLRPTWPTDWFGLVLFAVTAILTEWLAIEIYARDTTISTSAAPLLAGALLFGPAGVLVLSLTQAGATWLKHRLSFSRFVFNAANEVIAGLLVYALAHWLGWPFPGQPFWIRLPVTLLCAGVVYLSTTALVAGVIDLNSGQPFRQVWTERFRWLWPYYVALGAVAYALVFNYLQAGLVGAIIVLVPLFMLRVSQMQYLSHTGMSVARLRESNAALKRQASEISELNEELLLALSQAIDLRDPDVHDHSKQVARYAVLVAKELRLPPERVDLVRKAGLLHDVGKLGIPEAILFKPARLSLDEYRIVQQHAMLGAEIVANCHSLQSLIPVIRHHHERLDGRGYPHGLRGSDIPLEARILSVADAVEAMASDRPYRRGQDVASIIHEVQTHAGTQFDTAVVDAFVNVVRRDGANVIVNSARSIQQPGGAGGLSPVASTTISYAAS